MSSTDCLGCRSILQTGTISISAAVYPREITSYTLTRLFVPACGTTWEEPALKKLEVGRFLKYTNYPVYRMLAEMYDIEFTKDTPLFNMVSDSEKPHPLQDPAVEGKMAPYALCDTCKARQPRRAVYPIGINRSKIR